MNNTALGAGANKAQNNIIFISDAHEKFYYEKLKEVKSGELTLAMVRLILTEEKPKERKVTIKSEKISRYFTEEYSSEEIENIIYQLLEEWNAKHGVE